MGAVVLFSVIAVVLFAIGLAAWDQRRVAISVGLYAASVLAGLAAVMAVQNMIA